jgi:hypothetical protein
VSPGEFVYGGFVHRFILAHEIHRPQEIEEVRPDPGALKSLADRARGIWERAPQEVVLSKEADKLLKTYKEQAEDRSYDVSSLAGFWNRLGNMAAKLALGFALSEESWVISEEHVRRAEKFLRGHVAPPLRALVLELGFEKGTRRIFKVSEDLYYAKEKGILVKELVGRLGVNSVKQVTERTDLMKSMGLLIQVGDRAYHPSFKPS